jgi:hypothetical protein
VACAAASRAPRRSSSAILGSDFFDTASSHP